jgi:hypothetical protein
MDPARLAGESADRAGLELLPGRSGYEIDVDGRDDVVGAAIARESSGEAAAPPAAVSAKA